MNWSSWFIVSLILFVIEILTPGAFFFACLGIGASIAGVSVFLAPPSWVPWIVFTVVSLASIYAIRPVARKLFQVNIKKSNVDALIGHRASVTETINPPELGMVKIEGEFWRAEAEEKIEKGNNATVISVNGTRLMVKREVTD